LLGAHQATLAGGKTGGDIIALRGAYELAKSETQAMRDVSQRLRADLIVSQSHSDQQKLEAERTEFRDIYLESYISLKLQSLVPRLQTANSSATNSLRRKTLQELSPFARRRD
jgi:hypothetical protein